MEAFRSLRLRLALPFVGLVALVLVVLTLVVGRRAEQLYVDRLGDELEDQAIVLAHDVDRMMAGGASADRLAASFDQLGARTGTRLTLIAADGTVIADSVADPAGMENHNARPEVAEARRTGVGVADRRSETVDTPYLYVAVPVDDPEGMIVRVAKPMDDVAATVADVQRTILVADGLAIILTLVLAWWMAGRLAGPLLALRDQARSVAAGDFSATVAPSGIPEFDAVGRSFNAMTATLARSVRAQEQTSVRLEAVLAGLADGVVLTDAEGLVLRLNEAAQQMLEVEESRARGRPFVQVCRDHEMASVLHEALRRSTSPAATIVYGLNRRALTVTARTIEGAHERLGLVVLRDVSELRRLERVRREFVANVSHELRTPLTSIRALVETLEAGAIDDPEVAAGFLGRVLVEVDRLNGLVEDLLELARLEAGRAPLQLERVDLGEVVRQGADRLRPQTERAQLALAVEVANDLPKLEIDAKKVEQVLLNLVHNAIKFTPPGGHITLRVLRRGQDVVVQVQDTGVGIPEDEQGRLFERFYKSDKARRSEGTGLGLAIAKHIVQLHGGEIGVESVVGQGSTFWFTLPISRKRARRRARRHLLAGELPDGVSAAS